MFTLSLTGTSHQIGVQHGSSCKSQIQRCLIFYEKLFLSRAKMSWPVVRSFASKYQPYLIANWPHYVAEMQGVAEGASVLYEDILALNVRTEIAFGAFSDGCTAIAMRDGEGYVLGQNWDWDIDQADNLICLKITSEKGRTIQMITEAGIIGKIGFNDKGVGCTLNAIKAKGVAYDKLPCHLALRTVLESSSRDVAVDTLIREGVASACHILVADPTGGVGLECSSEDISRLEMDGDGKIVHTNHYVLKHKEGVKGIIWPPDTRFRLGRVTELLNAMEERESGWRSVQRVLSDGMEGDGAAICRALGKDGLVTLFSIMMDLRGRKADVMVGRPSEPKGRLLLEF
ncbi:hypothetical protein B7494_g4550 [Chlorociboria aeruginascens]|nr:hypothetical protein B7494_g4550 [Chlorociboria aeruginascens]